MPIFLQSFIVVDSISRYFKSVSSFSQRTIRRILQKNFTLLAKKCVTLAM